MAIPDFDEIVLNHNELGFIPNFESSPNLEGIFDLVVDGTQDDAMTPLGLFPL
jgi:hypothetical protein